MNYLREILAFNDLQLVNPLSSGQIALWHALMCINNKSGWREWFTVANQTLELLSGLSQSGIYKARNALKQKGYIDFKTKGANRATEYRVISLSAQESDSSGTSTSNITSKGSSAGSSNTLVKQNKRKGNETKLKEKRNKKQKREKERERSKKDIVSRSSEPDDSSDEIPYKEIVDYLNKKTNSRYRPGTTKTRAVIKARHREGFELDDFKKVINVKVEEWGKTDMAKYLRPETLFGSKFEGYLNQPSKAELAPEPHPFALDPDEIPW